MTLGSSTFAVDFHVVPFHGSDAILGVAWLEQLKRVTFDYEKRSLTFGDGTETIVDLPSTARKVPASRMSKEVDTSSGDQLFFIKVNHLPDLQLSSHQDIQHDMPAVQVILDYFADAFAAPHGLPPQRDSDHEINIHPGAGPVKVRPYRYPYFQKAEISRLVDNMIADGIIQPNRSPYSSPVIHVRKSDRTWRFCVDYRALNNITVKDAYPIPTVDEIFDELHDVKFFSKIDLKAGFHQIRVSPSSIEKTAFRTPEGHYEFLVMPFGLCNAPSTFQSTMNIVFKSQLRKSVMVFFDDILIYSKDWVSHLSHLCLALATLTENALVANQSKCEFALNSISYLGHRISSDGVAVDPSKIEVISNRPAPTSVRQLRGFLGLSGYYQRFVRRYASIATPLSDLLCKDKFVWTPVAAASFIALKQSLNTTPVLRLPNFEEHFNVETDASGFAMGAVLTQRGHPLSFFSKQYPPNL